MGKGSTEGIGMVTPEYLDEVIRATEDRMSDVNLYLTKKLAKRVIDTFYAEGEIRLIPSSIKDFHKLINAGAVVDDIADSVAKCMPTMSEEIKKAFYSAANEINIQEVEVARNIIEVEGLDVKLPELPEHDAVITKASELNMTPTEIRMLDSVYKHTLGEVKNLTKTTYTEAKYIEVCDSAFMKVKHGISVDTAVTEAIKELANKGMTVVEKNGRETSVEVAVARAVRTGINQANAKVVLQRNAEMGVGWVKVSEHFGARDIGTDDFRSHAWWQGKVYSIDWNKSVLAEYKPSAKLTDKTEYLSHIKDVAERKQAEEYPDFVETTGYGNILGLCGVNCRHTFQAWYPGMNIDKGQRIDRAKNKEIYDKQQKARAMERQIRKQKRIVAALGADGSPVSEDDIKLEQAKLNNMSDKYMDFCQQNRVTPTNFRLQTASGKARTYTNKTVEANISTLADSQRLPDLVEKAKVIREAIAAKSPVYAEDLRKVCKNVEQEEGFLDIFIHGSSHFVEYEHKYKLDAQTMAWIISGRKEFKGQDIRLLSCSTGAVDKHGNCFAQQLANELGVCVKAPIDVLNIGLSDGKLTVGKSRTSFRDASKIFEPKR